MEHRKIDEYPSGDAERDREQEHGTADQSRDSRDPKAHRRRPTGMRGVQLREGTDRFFDVER